MWSVFALSVFFLQGTLGHLVVQVQNGKVNGTTVPTPSGRDFYAWRGIPYGKPPLNKLRFLKTFFLIKVGAGSIIILGALGMVASPTAYRAPVKAEPWEGIWDATKDSPACVNFTSYPTDPVPLYGTSEDCLYINVYSPVPVDDNSSVNPTRTVLVWIYGGGFSTGSSDFGVHDPTAFLEEDVIVVTFNYRLGPLGFLSTQDEVIHGNGGLKDQNLALKWVRDNIAAFGGNRSDVTIFGESAGGASVGLHVVSPMSRNLFKGAIMQSGTALLSTQQANARQYAVDMASKIDSSITSLSTSKQIRDVLQAAPLDTIIRLTGLGMVGPVREIKSDQSFITEPLYEAVEAGNIAQVPVIVGFNSEESLGYGNDPSMYVQIASMFDTNPLLTLPGNFKLKENVSAEEVGAKIHEQYAGKNGRFSENLAAYFRLSSDNFMGRSCTKHGLLQSKFTPVYLYEFSYYGTTSRNNLIVPGAGKVAHAQEVGYQFNISTNLIVTPRDFLTRRRFVKLWTNFAKTSNPTPDDESADLLQNVKWEAIDENNIKYLDIDENLEFKPSYRLNAIQFWNNIWETYSYRPYDSY